MTDEIDIAPREWRDPIVASLREPVALRYNAEQINAERRRAAAEIERLRERCEGYKGQVLAGSMEIERLKKLCEGWADKWEKEQAENERLRTLHRSNIASMEEAIRRFDRYGVAHYELDGAIKETRAALERKS